MLSLEGVDIVVSLPSIRFDSLFPHLFIPGSLVFCCSQTALLTCLLSRNLLCEVNLHGLMMGGCALFVYIPSSDLSRTCCYKFPSVLVDLYLEDCRVYLVIDCY
jgi:hypothetical protein